LGAGEVFSRFNVEVGNGMLVLPGEPSDALVLLPVHRPSQCVVEYPAPWADKAISIEPVTYLLEVPAITVMEITNQLK